MPVHELIVAAKERHAALLAVQQRQQQADHEVSLTQVANDFAATFGADATDLLLANPLIITTYSVR